MSASGWTDRTIRGPAAEYLTAAEMDALFGLPRDWLDAKVKAGEMPAPVKLTARTVVYTWEHAVFLSLWMKLHKDGEKTLGAS